MTWADFQIINPTLTDDTGLRRAVHFANWQRVYASVDAEAKFAIDAVARVVRPFGGSPGFATIALIGVLAIGAVWEVVHAIQNVRAGSPDLLFGPAVLLACCVYVLWYLPRWNLWRHGPAIVPVLAARGLCPCCGYSLREIAPTDGLVQCPECGSKWQAARLNPVDAAESVRDGVERIANAAGVRRPLTDDHRKLTFAILRTPKRAAAAEADASIRTRQLHANEALRRVGAPTRFVILFPLAVVIGVCVLAAVLPVSWSSVVECLQRSAVFVLAAVLVARSYLGLSPALARDHMLERELCPTCASDLASTPTGPDGCRRCLVCGAAWRFDAATGKAPALPTTTITPSG